MAARGASLMFTFDTVAALSMLPELEELSTDEIEHLVQLAKQRRDDALWIVPAVIFGALWIVFLVGAVLLLLTVRDSAAVQESGGSMILISALLAVLCGGLLLVTVVGSVSIRRRMILRSIRLIRSAASCPYCGFDIRGLPVAARRFVKCPECGSSVDLVELGLTPSDLKAPSRAARRRAGPKAAAPSTIEQKK